MIGYKGIHASHTTTYMAIWVFYTKFGLKKPQETAVAPPNETQKKPQEIVPAAHPVAAMLSAV